MDVSAAFGKTLRKYRIKKDLTQEELGLDAGLRRTFISSLELGQKQPSLQTIQKLCLVLDISMSKFLQAVEKELQK
ncbi:helix-turn-helix domain-containing protein [Polynucleobacter corsicus]|uniref:helix-turn-helix domain-containing protein n=1 Tax=Polynucleobacter corsicus TaxID=2081042 RepID=UPI001BFD338E|nr:helix-turn-helix transcriptional regulator [Polynucleobacter corsicus]QWE19485.1 helix-turn-helix transcriptional regulator [Polynucleobacter corsicus]